MKNRDIIKTFERTMLVRFGTTGQLQSLSTLRLEGVTFKRSGNSIHADYNNGHPAFLLEQFPSEPLATSAFERLQTVLTRYAQIHRMAAVGKGLIKWVAAPFVFGVLALAINMVATRAVDSTAALAAQSAPPMLPLPTSMELIQQNMGVPPTPQQPAQSPQLMAKALTEGVKLKKFSVQLSSGPKGTLYVFSDPSCPHCQNLEPELEQLAKDYTIHILPVSVIGQAVSTARVAKVLCAKPAARAPLWRQVIEGADLQTAQCEDGTTAVAANNTIWSKFGLTYTPVIINAAGVTKPDTVDFTAGAIDQWMKSKARG